MRRIGWIRLALAGCIALATPAHAEIYRYVDAGGREHWTEDPSEVPPDQRSSLPSSGGSLSGFEPSEPRARATEPAPRASRPAPAAMAPPGPPVELVDGRDASDWRAEAESYAQRIEEARAALEKCQEQDARRRLVYGLTDLDECATKEARSEEAESDLEHFEDRARRSGVPPGWLR